ncbi:putative 2-oxoglutarate-dependent dioxygenase [Colletotrichum shisoi]|uniref:Putative 2-oxoglutarate-dependent dioxygenase n=1 Tax=Colletotrichum shisoi TaxID=2078593 RepID=A0A5Q4BCC6_9PEZI|nr:putative 2-oxoglutarate-dependent dioxygenase [Colletotrichum shisoi]
MAPGFTEIPQINLSLADNPASEAALLDQLRHALVHVSFLYVVNHGVPDETVADVVRALPRLFALPPTAKDKIALRNSPHFLGYSGDGSETTAGRRDRREQVEFATELSDGWSAGLPLRERLRGPNQPSSYPELRPIVKSYIAEMTLLGERFLRLVAKALSLPPKTFLPFLSDQHRLKLVHYPALTESEAASGGGGGSQGVSPHKDSSRRWTFLLQASPPHVGRPQALNKDGGWVDVPVVPGSFVVNIGQAFEVVTGGACRATTHRVLAGPLERFSVPFFQGVRRDLTKEEAAGSLRGRFDKLETRGSTSESNEGRGIDSAFLKGKYDTWGESQLRTKIRSHRDVGKKFYADVFNQYINDDL